MKISQKKSNFQEQRCYERKKEKTVRVIKTWCVSVRLSLSPCPSRLHTHMHFHFQTHTSLLHPLVVWPRLFAQSQKRSFNTAKDAAPGTLPPSFQIQYFTLLAGILVHVVKLHGWGWGRGYVATHHTLALQSSTVGHLTVTTRSCLLEKLHEGRL